MRVVMLYRGSGPAFLDDWARAAATVAEVVTIRIGKTSGIRGIPNYSVPQLRLRPKRFLGPTAQQLMARRLARTIRRIELDHGRIDVLHGHFYSGARTVSILSRRTGIPYVISEHSSRLTGNPASHKPLTRQGLKIASEAYADAARILVVSEYLAERIRQLALPGDLDVIGNPVDTHLFHPADRPMAGRPIRIVSVGRLEEDKQPLRLLKAFLIARAQESSLSLELIGDGPDRTRVDHFVEGLGPAPAISIVGQLSRQAVAERVRSAHVFALASKIETFCLSAAEALASGVPVVMPSVGAVPELVGNHAGILADDSSPGAIANALLQVLRNVAQFDPQSLAAYIERRFSFRSIGDRLAEIYEEASASRATRPRSSTLVQNEPPV